MVDPRASNKYLLGFQSYIFQENFRIVQLNYFQNLGLYVGIESIQYIKPYVADDFYSQPKNLMTREYACVVWCQYML